MNGSVTAEKVKYGFLNVVVVIMTSHHEEGERSALCIYPNS
jgi:hypothetical protein